MKESINVGEHKFEVDFSYFGSEKYYLDGELIHKSWNFSLSGTREFKVGSRQLRIEVSVKPSNYYCKVYLDEELYIEELFPAFKDKVDKRNKRFELPSPFWKKLLLVIVCGALCLSIFNKL